MTIVEMRVHMDCQGCQSKIRKALKKLHVGERLNYYPPNRHRTKVVIHTAGVDNIDIDMHMQKVTVTGWAEQKKVLKTVRKTGRRAELWPYPYNPEYHNYMHHYYDTFYSRPGTYFAPPSSSYNYYVHGYNIGHAHGYYAELPHNTIFDERTRHMFSDENATGCSIM